jgi:methylmalonyl-CoA mutase N-terminal domain/subunit
MHTNSFDEALGLPTSESALLALRTQQILGYETGIAEVVDPLAGSYYVEHLTDSIEHEAKALIGRIDALGGAVAAIGEGFQQREIEAAAYAYATDIDAGARAVVGVNRFATEDSAEPEVLQIDPELEAAQVASLKQRRARRDAEAVATALAQVGETALGTGNLLYPMKTALLAGASIGEITEAMLPVFGRYRPAT